MSDPDTTDRSDPTATPSTEAVLFLSVGALTLVIFVLFAILGNDNGGKALLALTAGFSLVMGGYLWFRARRGGFVLEPEATGAEGPWFPGRSVWPITVAGGAACLVGGLALGPWVWLPGGLLLARGLWGFTMESRHRDV